MTMTSDKDYYEILGVPSDATQEDIKRAYRKLARQWHPDVNPDNPDAADKFKELGEAYEVLRDPERRRIYDRFGTEGLRGGAAGAGPGFTGDFGGFGDLFEAFFGGGGRQPTTGPRRGEDLRYDLEITLEEAAYGVDRTVRLSHLARCETCRGSGAAGGKAPQTCPACHGAGQVRQQQNTFLGSFATITTCGVCGGEGEIIRDPCEKCRGEGRRRTSEEVTLHIPPGVDTGARLKVTGKGNAGPRGGPQGDYYVVLHVKRHERFQRNGDDLTTEVPVGIAQAALGATIKVPTLWGEEEIEARPGTQPGHTVHLRGQGMPVLNGGGRGTLHVVLRVVVPTDLTPEQKEALKQYADLRGEESEMEKGFFDRLKDHFTGR